jgi:NosR/NirI family transcriptional regulator, nitrous oxide reductase regulator
MSATARPPSPSPAPASGGAATGVAPRLLRAWPAAARSFLPALSLVVALTATLLPQALHAQPYLAQFLAKLPAGELVEGADGYGPIRPDLPVAPVMRGGQTLGWAFITTDFVRTIGYAGKPIHVMVAVDADARVIGVHLVAHSEPIVLIGISEARIAELIATYRGFDLAAAAAGEGHDLSIISGATVTVMVIDDSILRAGLRVARALGLGGLGAIAAPAGPRFELEPEAEAAGDWLTLLGDGTVRRLSLDVGQINRAFAALDDPRAAARALTEPDDAVFIDLYTTLVSIPAIGEALLGPREAANLRDWLGEGEHAILVAARGSYSFKGSGYVRGGIFDRIQLIQGDTSVRFRDREHRRVGDIAAAGAPRLGEMDLFKIPADAGFDPTAPWRLQLLVGRDVAAIERVFTTFDLPWQPPERFLRPIAAEPVPELAAMASAEEEQAARTALWQRIWHDKRFEIAAVLAMLTALTLVFFFQGFVTRSAPFTFWFRMGFLTLTLVFLGWYASAQLSIVNLMALANSLRTGFTWDAFLMDPLTFILWFSVAAALIFWGRGAYCGWLCPFGALQELTNRIARALRVPQWRLPWGLHERLVAVKYMVFLALFAVTLASLDHAEALAEIEPFKTAIVLKFDRAWPFVLYALVLLGIGLFIERFYCRYLCPLGAALAIPARIRMFDWLKRYRECGHPCRNCASECLVQAIHPTGEINPNECLNCLNCQVLYQSETKCPVVMKRVQRRRAAQLARSGAAPAAARAEPLSPRQKELPNV